MKTMGYVVNCEMEAGGPMALLTRANSIWKNVPRGGVLLSDSREATAFLSRHSALEAIKRTKSYRPHPEWPDDAYSIRRLVAKRER